MGLISIEQAIKDIKQGKMVILVDDEDRENEGDLTIAAEKVTPEAVNFMARYGRGLICLSLTPDKVAALDLPSMVRDNTSRFETAFTVSIEARHGVTTGISAADRATTIAAAVADDAKPHDLVQPGHVFPLRARRGGTIVRSGQTEGSVDLAKLAGLTPAGVICEIMNDNGTMARMPDLEKFSKEHNIGICTIADLIEYRLRAESFVHPVTTTVIPTCAAGEFKITIYENDVDDFLHMALVKGEIDPEKSTLVRVHSECLTGDVFGSMRCDCGEQLETAMTMMEGHDTVEANQMLGFKSDLRNYGLGAQILVDLGVRKMRLLTNNPKKIVGLQGYGLTVTEQIPIEMKPNQYNQRYLDCKKSKMGHLLKLDSQH